MIPAMHPLFLVFMGRLLFSWAMPPSIGSRLSGADHTFYAMT